MSSRSTTCGRFDALRFETTATPGLGTVVIPVFRDAAGLEATLSSLQRQTLPSPRFEVIVCNDGADEAVSELCRRHSVTEIRIPRNRGSYFARNRGLEAARGEHIAFVDADISVPETWLEVGFSALRRAHYVGGPVIVDRSRARTPADHYEVLTGFRSNRPDSGENFFVTANLFVKRSVFERIGGFDERLRSGGDNEFGRRVHAEGEFVQEFLPELAVLHPPRGYRKLVNKKARIAYGKEVLNQLYPDRYAYKRPSAGRLLLNILLPPSLKRARRLSTRCPEVGLGAWYLFLWRFKVETAIRRLPVPRRALDEAEGLRSQGRALTTPGGA